MTTLANIKESGGLQGSVAVVTGATSGIGRAIASALTSAGCKVVATGRNPDRLRELSEALGPAVLPLSLDLADHDAIAGLPGRLPPEFRTPAILVNNAGEDVGGRTRFDESSADELARVIEINLIGTIRMVRALVPSMIERGSGDIVNVGSTQQLRTTQNMAVYTASKLGAHGLTDVLRADYAKSGIRVMEIVPGLTRTNFAQSRWRGDEERARAYFEKLPPALSPDDVADSVHYALTRPRHVNLHQIVITPSWQW